MSVPGAVGHAVGLGNKPVIKILVEQLTPGLEGAAPQQLEGVPVEVEEIGHIVALPVCAKRKN